jgi:hypothetical protein
MDGLKMGKDELINEPNCCDVWNSLASEVMELVLIAVSRLWMEGRLVDAIIHL